MPVCPQPGRLQQVTAKNGDRPGSLVSPDLPGDLVDDGYDRHVSDKAGTEEWPRVHTVDHEVVLAVSLAPPVAPGLPVDAEAPAASYDLHSVSKLPRGPVVHGGTEDGHLVAALRPLARDRLQVDFGATGPGMREIPPVVGKDPQRSVRRPRVLQCSGGEQRGVYS